MRKNTIITLAIIVVALVTGAIFVLTRSEEHGFLHSTLSDEDTEDITQTISEFLDGAANFGINGDGLTGDDLMDIRYGNTDNELITTRMQAYKTIQPLLSEQSKLQYNNAIAWSNDFETSRAATFTLIDKTITVDTNVGSIDDVDSASADVTFTTKETTRSATMDDSSWDGTFIVSEKTFTDTTMRVILVREDDGWRIQDIKGLDSQFLLATWNNPDSNEYMSEQHDFINTGETLKANLIPHTQ